MALRPAVSRGLPISPAGWSPASPPLARRTFGPGNAGLDGEALCFCRHSPFQAIRRPSRCNNCTAEPVYFYLLYHLTVTQPDTKRPKTFSIFDVHRKFTFLAKKQRGALPVSLYAAVRHLCRFDMALDKKNKAPAGAFFAFILPAAIDPGGRGHRAESAQSAPAQAGRPARRPFVRRWPAAPGADKPGPRTASPRRP